MGIFEIDAFGAGTMAVAARARRVPGTTVVGGGDSVAALRRAGRLDAVTHVSRAVEPRSVPRGQTLPGSPRSDKEHDMSRMPLIAGNWKMHGARSEGWRCPRPSPAASARSAGREIVLAPPFTALEVSQGDCRAAHQARAQNVHWEPKGAFTGEVLGLHVEGSRLRVPCRRPLRAAAVLP
jgi:hypothetical protein